jgi:hypothetical protein
MLTRLNASPDYIVHLLKAPDSLPKLQFITISMHIGPGEPFDIDNLEHVLHPVSRRMRGANLSLEIYVDSDSSDWMDLNVNDRGDERALRCVTSLELTAGHFVTATPAMQALFPCWLVLFPVLRHVSFLSWNFAIALDERIAFIRSLSNICNIQTVQIDEEQIAIADWIHG